MNSSINIQNEYINECIKLSVNRFINKYVNNTDILTLKIDPSINLLMNSSINASMIT